MCVCMHTYMTSVQGASARVQRRKSEDIFSKLVFSFYFYTAQNMSTCWANSLVQIFRHFLMIKSV